MQHTVHQVGDQGIEHLLEGFVRQQMGGGVGIGAPCLIEKSSHEWDVLKHRLQLQDARAQPVLKVCR